MLRSAAFASSVRRINPDGLALHQPGVRETLQDPRKAASCVSRSIKRRVREIVE